MKRNLVGKILGKIKIFVQDFVPIRTALTTRQPNISGQREDILLSVLWDTRRLLFLAAQRYEIHRKLRQKRWLGGRPVGRRGRHGDAGGLHAIPEQLGGVELHKQGSGRRVGRVLLLSGGHIRRMRPRGERGRFRGMVAAPVKGFPRCVFVFGLGGGQGKYGAARAF